MTNYPYRRSLTLGHGARNGDNGNRDMQERWNSAGVLGMHHGLSFLSHFLHPFMHLIEIFPPSLSYYG